MKKILKWSIGCLLFCLLSCNKNEDNPISTWVINNDTFSAFPGVTKGKALSRMWVDGSVNNFRIGFSLSYLPISGNWPIDVDAGQNPDYARISFYYNKVFYLISSHENGYLIASKKNKKASYRLEPTWYVNYDNPEDSVLIQGTFNEP